MRERVWSPKKENMRSFQEVRMRLKKRVRHDEQQQQQQEDVRPMSEGEGRWVRHRRRM